MNLYLVLHFIYNNNYVNLNYTLYVLLTIIIDSQQLLNYKIGTQPSVFEYVLNLVDINIVSLTNLQHC